MFTIGSMSSDQAESGVLTGDTAGRVLETPALEEGKETLPACNRVYTGDCISIMRSWPAGFIDLIFADPPYNIGYRYDVYEDRRDDQEYVTWTRAWIDACTRLLKPTGSFWILIGDEYAAEVRLHLKDLERARRLVFRNWIVWHYTFGQNCRTKFNRSHAHLFYCVGPALFERRARQPLPFTFNREAIAIPSARQLVYRDARAHPAGKVPDDTWYLRPQEAMADNAAQGAHFFEPDGDVWHLSRLCGTFNERMGWHPCQLPEALLERVIRVGTNPGDLVFDPFAGSGTTLAVAARLGRRWLGCELSPEYASRAQARAEHAAATGQPLVISQDEKGIGGRGGRPTKKKPEPKRSRLF